MGDHSLLQLPKTEDPMCNPYHTKGISNPGCPFRAIHAQYLSMEYHPLEELCRKNYPKMIESLAGEN